MTVLTVMHLMDALRDLDPSTHIYESTWASSGPCLDWSTVLRVYRKGSEMRLYLNDGEGSSPKVDPHCKSLPMPPGITPKDP